MHVLAALLVVAGQGQPFAVPLKGDETPLVRVKANPERYVGKVFIICGGLFIGDFYNYFYEGRQDTHYSLRFFDVGKTSDVRGETAYLYLLKAIGAEIVEGVSKRQETGYNNAKLARLRVMLRPEAYARGKQWDMFEVVDVQFIQEDRKDWQPWIVATKAEKERQAAQAAAKRRVEEEAAQEQRKKAEREANAPKFREWTDATGKHKTVARP